MGRLHRLFHLLVQEFHLRGRKRIVVDAGQHHFAVPGGVGVVAAGVAADPEPQAGGRCGEIQLAGGVGLALHHPVDIEVGLSFLLVPDAHGMIVHAGLRGEAARRPDPFRLAVRAHVREEVELRPAGGGGDQEPCSARLVGAEHLHLGGAVGGMVRLEDNLERMAVGERLPQRLVIRVVHPVEAAGDGRTHLAVECGHAAAIGLVLIGDQVRAGKIPDRPPAGGDIFRTPVRGEDDVQQVRLRGGFRFRLGRRFDRVFFLGGRSGILRIGFSAAGQHDRRQQQGKAEGKDFFHVDYHIEYKYNSFPIKWGRLPFAKNNYLWKMIPGHMPRKTD